MREYLITYRLYGSGDALISARTAKEAREKWLESASHVDGHWDIDREGAPKVRLYRRTQEGRKGQV